FIRPQEWDYLTEGTPTTARPRSGLPSSRSNPLLNPFQIMALSQPHGIPDEFRTEFFTVLDHEIQQVQSKFSDRVRIVDVNGKEKTFGSLEQSEFTRRSGRLEKSAPTEAEIHSRKL